MKINHFQDVSAVLTDKDSLKKIRGIGFDATCSLVALDSTGHAVTVSPSREAHRNIIMCALAEHFQTMLMLFFS